LGESEASPLDSPVVVGVDPGSATTGVAVRVDGRCLDASTVRRRDGEPEAAYHARVIEQTRRMAATHRAGTVAVEGVDTTRQRNGRVLAALAATGRLVDAVVAAWPAAVVVPPAPGRESTTGVPADLVGARPRRYSESDTTDRRHERAAFTVAGEATRKERAA
jgi:hypothetical protein